MSMRRYGLGKLSMSMRRYGLGKSIHGKVLPGPIGEECPLESIVWGGVYLYGLCE